MSRTDAQQLNVPAVPNEPIDDLKHTGKPESQVASILDSLEKKQVLINRCQGCKGTLSVIERKMGRCQTCGKTIEDPQADQDSSPKPPAKFEVRI